MVILKQCRGKLEGQRLHTWTNFQIQLLQEIQNYPYRRAAELTLSLTSYNERLLPLAQCKLQVRTLSEHPHSKKAIIQRFTLLKKKKKSNYNLPFSFENPKLKVSQSLLPHSLDLPSLAIAEAAGK